MKLIGISGKIGAGKSELSRLLGGTRVAFGDLLKEECSAYFGFPKEWCYSQEGKMREINSIDCTKPFPPLRHDCGPTVRELLQWYGTDYRRAQDPDYWIKAMRRRLDDLAHDFDCQGVQGLVVVDDVRFPDEAELVLEEQGVLIRLEPFEGWQPGPHAGHVSETALDDFDRWTLKVRPPFGGLPDLVEPIMRLLE